ncbi:cilium assembly protein DZIP1 isoform X2 [Myripristis murdjan]|uniref:cilium assembly protein DZIP1 isoform X2 n=1 Tax=Myripristis murdjan TaxID=586833 RepID=UPI001175D96B|nr:zinc finger protein Dzip1-like isoform X2 [Myripristis murdjan]
MPFHNGVYYPYTTESQGTHSSAGIPSLLNSPLSQPSPNGHPASSPGMTPPTIPPFKFRPRRENVDWRRISAVDVDLVVSELDVNALQEHVNMVTFCSLEGERCQRCQSPVDPALVKLFRLAQLTVEWLLHCQGYLTVNLSVAEERLAAAGRDREQLLAQQKKQEDKVKELTAELKQRKKVLRTQQQSMLAPRIISSHKCPHCDKYFLNSSFLQNHMQRRHPDDYENQLQSDREKKSQIESLNVKIKSLEGQLVQHQQALQAKAAQEKEQQSMYQDLLRELDRFKAEEMARMDRKIEDSRDGMRREIEFLYSRNLQARNEANQCQTVKSDRAASPVQRQAERDLDNYKEMQTQAIQRLEQQLKKQDKKWESRLQEIKNQHESEKNQLLNELSRMESSVSEHQKLSQRLREEMKRRLQEKEHTIIAQREQIKNISSNPPTKVVEVPVIVTAPAPEPKPKRVVLDSSISERRTVEKKPELPPERKQRVTPNTLRKNPNIKKELRPALEQALIEKLEDLGVKAGQGGLRNKELSSIMVKVRSERESIASEMPDYWHYREEVANTVEQKLRGQRRGSDPAPEPQAKAKHSIQVTQNRPRSSSLPSRVTQVMCGPPVKQPKTPQPAPRTRTTALPKTSTPNTKSAVRTFTPKTPPFSSDEESEEDDTDMEEEQPQKHRQEQWGKSPQTKPNQATPIQIRTSKASPVLARQTPVKQSMPSRGPVSVVTRTSVTAMESDEEESEVSEMQEIDLTQLQSYKDQNGNVDKKNFGKESKTIDMARKMEKQFADRMVKKPLGGVSILPERKDIVQELTLTDLEDTFGEETPKPGHGSRPLRKSLDSPSTSVWGTSTDKEHKSGLTDVGTGSTLKSSLVSLSDISDSDDI